MQLQSVSANQADRPMPVGWRLLWFGAAYVGCAVVGRALSSPTIPFVCFWLPSGLFVAALLRNETKHWAAFAAVAFLANLGFDLAMGQPLLVGLLFAVGNCLEALAGAWLVRRWVGEKLALTGVRDLVAFVVIAAFLSTLVNAVLGATTVSLLSRGTPFGPTMLRWWSGGACGVLMVAPVILTWRRGALLPAGSRGRLEAAVLAAALLTVVWLAFGPAHRGMFPLKFVVVPFLMWAALRFGLRGAVTANLAMALAAATLFTRGPDMAGVFAGLVLEPITVFQAFLIVMILIGLFLAAVEAERNQREKALQESEERYRRLVHLSPDAIIIHCEGRIVFANAVALAFAGARTPAEFIGRPMLDFVHPDDYETVRQRVSQMLTTGLVAPLCEERFLRLDRSEFAVEVSAAAFVYEGKPAVQVVARDITDRKRLEAALSAQAETFRAVLATTRDGVIETDEHEHILEANQVYCGLLGYSLTELRSMRIRDVEANERPEEVVEHTRQLQREGGGRFESRHRAKDGRLIDLELNITHIAGRRRFVAFCHDITARKQAEAELQDLTTRLKLATESGQFGVWDLNLTTGQMIWDERMLTLYGHTRETFPGGIEAWNTGLHPDDSARAIAEFAAALDGEKPFHTEFRVVHPDGTVRDIEAHGIIIRDTSGHPLRALGLNSDNTARKRAEEAREEMARALERKNGELENLVYVTSHDLRSPLLNIQGFGERLKTGCSALNRIVAAESLTAADRAAIAALVGQQMPRSLEFIQTSVEKMDRLISGLLRLSRLGRAGLAFTALDLNAMLGEIRKTMAFALQTAGAEVEVGPLPPCQGDADQINQLFSNLLDNCLKYRDPARPLRVTISGRIDGRRAVYCVADNGAGIAAKHLDKIWDVFFRADPGGAAAGDGLGLNLVRRIVERHQGEIWVESTLGEGSRFIVALPLAEANGPAQEAHRSPR